MQEPGLSRHEWESEWAALQEQLEESPAEALTELDDLLERAAVKGYRSIYEYLIAARSTP